MPDETPHEMMTRGEVADLCRTTWRTVSRWAYTNYGPPYVQIGRQTLYRRTDVQAWLDKKFEAAADAA